MRPPINARMATSEISKAASSVHWLFGVESSRIIAQPPRYDDFAPYPCSCAFTTSGKWNRLVRFTRDLRGNQNE